jgi:hypothetical protein
MQYVSKYPNITEIFFSIVLPQLHKDYLNIMEIH